jgi:hypothetical protein
MYLLFIPCKFKDVNDMIRAIPPYEAETSQLNFNDGLELCRDQMTVLLCQLTTKALARK